MNLTKTLIATSFLLCANFALANHHEGAHEDCKNMKKMDFSMKELDTNKDGNISTEKYAVAGHGDIDKNFPSPLASKIGRASCRERVLWYV